MEAVSLCDPCPVSLMVADRLVQHATTCSQRVTPTLCPSCNKSLDQPVTALCGHTRCYKCAVKNMRCICGKHWRQAKRLNVNVLVQSLIKNKITVSQLPVSSFEPTPSSSTCTTFPTEPPHQMLLYDKSGADVSGVVGPLEEGPALVLVCEARGGSIKFNVDLPFQSSEPMDFHVQKGRLEKAIARMAVASSMLTKEGTRPPSYLYSRFLLASIITTVCDGQDPRLMTGDLLREVGAQFTVQGLQRSDLECIICYNLFRQPITTACGHTFCKPCIYRIMITRLVEGQLDEVRCPLCAMPLNRTHLWKTKETEFVQTVVDRVTLSSQFAYNYIPVFECTAAFPETPFPMLLLVPLFRTYVGHILMSDQRRFGMIAGTIDGIYYGTILEIKDCVRLQDGSSILSTIGISRFKVLDWDEAHGIRFARVEEITDCLPQDELFLNRYVAMLFCLAQKARAWMKQLPKDVRAEIERTLGPAPEFVIDDLFWQTPDGPAWLWWLMSILPIDSQVHTQLLAEQNLLLRMMRIAHIMNTMDESSITPCAKRRRY